MRGAADTRPLAVGPPLTAFEVAASGPLGGVPVTLPPPTGLTPAEALQHVMVEPLRRGRCHVSFSGGRDSSLVLAAAVAAARSHGLEPPVPVTLVFPQAAAADEEHWQRRVLEHLGVCRWERITVTDELDFLGPVAREARRALGPLYPANAHCHVPIYELAAGGSVLTGTGGDHVIGAWRWQAAGDVVAGRTPPSARALRHAMHARGPVLIRRRLGEARATATPCPWLTAPVNARVTRLLASQRATEPATWSRRVPWQAGLEFRRRSARSAAALAQRAGTEVAHPLIDPIFLEALARAGGVTGFGDRTATMRACFASLLPDDVLCRSSKATFAEALWNRESRAFARDWSGAGVDETIIDVAGLQRLWRGDAADTRTALLLQHIAEN